MNNSDQLKMFLSMFVGQLPILLVCLLGVVVVLIRWRQASSGSLWALLGFGLALFLCVAVPVIQTAVQHWVMQSGDMARRAFVFSGLSILWSVLRAATYGLLLVAVFAGRSPAAPSSSRFAAG